MDGVMAEDTELEMAADGVDMMPAPLSDNVRDQEGDMVAEAMEVEDNAVFVAVGSIGPTSAGGWQITVWKEI